MTTNSCGGCTACCRVVPVAEIGIKRYEGCPHIREPWHAAGPGCGAPGGYDKRPFSCKSWSCMWLLSDWAPEQRPDRLGIVVDQNIELIRVEGVDMPAAQIWVLPGHEDDWHKPAIDNIIMTLIVQERVAVLWILPPGDDAIVFCRHPKTGALSRSDPRAATPNAEEVLGTGPERMLRGGALYERSNRKQKRIKR